MTTLLPNAKQQFVDALGVPLGLGQVFFYVPGTTTFKNTWQDNQQVTLNANPVQLDSAGRAIVFGSGDYRQIVQDKNANTIWDQISSSPGTDLAPILAASSGATLIGTIQSGTGATPRTVQAKLRDTVHIADFGASPANTAAANNTAIQAAITYCISVGAELDFGTAGTYLVTGLTISGSSTFTLRLRGRGAKLSTITNAPILSVSTSQYVTIDGLNFLGNSNATLNSQHGLFFDTTSDISVEDCSFDSLSVGLYANNTGTGYPLSGGYQRPSMAHGNRFKACYRGVYCRDGGVANSYGEYWRVTNNTITDCNNAGIWDEAGNTAIIANTVNGNALGLVLFGSGTSNGDHSICSLNTVNHNVAVGIYVGSNLRNWTIIGNQVEATLGGVSGTQTLFAFFGGVNQGYAFGVYLDNVQDVTFVGNVVARNQVNMAVKTAVRSVIKDCQFLTDPALTVGNTVDYTAVFYPRGNFFGPNVYNGTWTDTTTFPTNGDWNRWLAVGGTGTAPFLNSWVNYGVGYAPAAYRKLGDGTVQLAGLIKTGTINLPAFNLPIDFRPSDGIKSFAVLSNSAMGGVQVSNTGDVNIVTPSSNVYAALDGVAFPAI